MSSENDKDVKLTGLQKAMARKMIASWTDVPQFQLESEVNCEAMMAFRKKQDYKLSYTAILAKAAADTLAEFPRLNSSWAGDHIVEHEDINIGIAVRNVVFWCLSYPTRTGNLWKKSWKN